MARGSNPPFPTWEAFEHAMVPDRDQLGRYAESGLLRAAWDQSHAWDVVLPHLISGATVGGHKDMVPLPAFVEAANGIGFVSVSRQVHRDGSLRKIEARLATTGGSALQFGLAAALCYRGLSPADVYVDDELVRIGDVELPLRHGRLWIDWPSSRDRERNHHNE